MIWLFASLATTSSRKYRFLSEQCNCIRKLCLNAWACGPTGT
jgi:hypothetical protein